MSAAVRPLLLLATASIPAAAFGQNLVDPSDRIYSHLSIWEQKGYADPLPPLRPYPLPIVVDALREVRARGTPRDIELAAAFADALGVDVPTVQAAAVVGVRGKGSVAGGDFGAVLRSQGSIGDHFSYSGAFRYWWDSTFGEEIAPRYRPDDVATFEGAGPHFDLGGESFRGLEDIRLVGAFAVGPLTIQGGFSSADFGDPRRESLVLSTHAAPAASLAAHLGGATLGYTAIFLDLVALRAARTTGETYSLKQELPPTGLPSKHLMLHALSWHALPWLTVSGVQGALFGGRLSLYSVLPTAFITEPFTGDYDNAFAGITLEAALPLEARLVLDAYVDDYQLVDPVAGFDPSPFANKVAGAASLSWAPERLPITASLDYTFVAPYTYSHSAHAALNYLTYTHRGRAIGTALPPNSDRWQVETRLWPLSWLDLLFAARYVRHGNGSDHGAGSVDGDGSIWDDGYSSSGSVTFFGESTFLNQDVLEGTLQLEVRVEAHLPSDALRAAGRAWLGLEHITNRGLDPAAETELNPSFGIGLEVGY